jgi:hypothetical protein
MPKPVTDTRYVVQSLLPAAGWHAVYWYDNAHVVWPVHCLAHVHQRTYKLRTRDRMPSAYPDDELWDISGMVYLNPIDGWSLCIDDSNYCGLMPPGMTLETFLDGHDCVCRPSPAPGPTATTGTVS